MPDKLTSSLTDDAILIPPDQTGNLPTITISGIGRENIAVCIDIIISLEDLEFVDYKEKAAAWGILFAARLSWLVPFVLLFAFPPMFVTSTPLSLSDVLLIRGTGGVGTYT